MKGQELDPVTWNEIYDTIQTFSKFDLTPEASFFEKVQNVFITKVNPNQQVQNLLTFVDKRRAESISSQFKLEEAKVKNELRDYVEMLSKSGRDDFSVSEVVENIRANRANNPRLFLSLKEEFNIFKRLLNERIKELQAGPASREIESLRQLSQLCQQEQFTFPSLIQKFSEKKDQLGTAVLQPEIEDFDKEAIEKLQVQRLFRLENLHEVYQRSLADPSNEITSKFFAPTYAWYVGSVSTQEEKPLELEMQAVGQKHGIQTISDRKVDELSNSVEITRDNRTDLMMDCSLFFQNIEGRTRTNLGDFNQDFVDFSKNGEVRVPRLKKMGEREGEKFYEEIAEFRKKREEEWKKNFAENPDARTSFLGVPFNDNFSLKAIALASSLDAIPVMNLTYNEGGNTLMGKNESGPYVIIGHDSFDVSKALMEKDLGRTMTEEEVRMAFAIDYGIKKENVFFVEQPGDFHLDMSMAIVGEKTVILNDAVVAQDLFAEQQPRRLEENIREFRKDAEAEAKAEAEKEGTEVDESSVEDRVKTIAVALTEQVNEEIQQAPARKRLEDITARDLEKQGFTVVRVPGRFHYSARVPANLFNFVAVKTPQGENLVVMMGCIDDEYQERFKDVLNKHSEQEINEFHFLDLQASQDCLVRGGGISCRTKTISQ